MSNDKNNGNKTDMIEQEFGADQGDQSLSKREQEGWGMMPQNMSEAMKLCKFIADTEMVPKDYRHKPADIFVCIQHGQEIGLKPLQSLNSVAVINGRPTVDTSTMLALARQHPDFEWIREDNEGFAYARDNVEGWEHLKDKNPEDTSICVVKRKGQPVTVREFSKEDVQRAGLGNVHKTYPKDMRKYRARGRALEAEFGDVLKGFKQTETERENVEVYGEDYEDADKAQAKVTGKSQVSASIKESMSQKSKKNASNPEPEEDPNEVDEADDIEDHKPEGPTSSTEAEQEEKGGDEAEDDPLKGQSREQVMEQITKEAKELQKESADQNFYQIIKDEVRLINEDAGNMLELNDEELAELLDVFT